MTRETEESHYGNHKDCGECETALAATMAKVEESRQRLVAMQSDMAAGNGTEVEIAHRHGFATRNDLARLMNTRWHATDEFGNPDTMIGMVGR